MTQFNAGQDVEVPWTATWHGREKRIQYRKAKIVRMAPDGGAIFNPVYETTLGLFSAVQIKAVESKAVRTAIRMFEKGLERRFAQTQKSN